MQHNSIFSSSTSKLAAFDKKRTLTWQFVEIGDAPNLGESASETENNLQS